MTVKDLRGKLELTQEGFASLLGVSFVSVNRWEKGQASPSGLSEVLLGLLADALHRQPPQVVLRALRSARPNARSILRVLFAMEGGDARHVEHRPSSERRA